MRQEKWQHQGCDITIDWDAELFIRFAPVPWTNNIVSGSSYQGQRIPFYTTAGAALLDAFYYSIA